jgi:hypothetical protein
VKYGKFINLDQPLLKYRIHPTAFSRKSSKVKHLTKQMVEEYHQSGKINKNMVEEIKKYRSLDSKRDKAYDYHVLLAKKYLWTNYHSNEARSHLRKAIRTSKGKSLIEPYLLILMSYLGEKPIKYIYKYSQKFR